MSTCSGDTYCQEIIDGTRCLFHEEEIGEDGAGCPKNKAGANFGGGGRNYGPGCRKEKGTPVEEPLIDPLLNPANPKQRYGDLKPDLSLIPGVAMAHEALAFETGAAKYGAYNWRDKPVEARTYIAAAKRHMDAWLDGEDFSTDTAKGPIPVHNLGHARACLAILLDCIELGTLLDNRPKPGASSAMHERIKAQRLRSSSPPEPINGFDVITGPSTCTCTPFTLRGSDPTCPLHGSLAKP